MNVHTDKWILDNVKQHYEEAITLFPEYRVVGVFYQGSGNYGLDYSESDVDTKCILLPTIEDLSRSLRVSKTHIRKNEEHIDFKDIRIFLDTVLKSNLNFVEILYTDYYVINPLYEDLWNKLVELRDTLINPWLLRKSIKGIASEKFHALEHPYPSRMKWIDAIGYDPKQLHHLCRLKQFYHRFNQGEPFERCLIANDSEWLVSVKCGHYQLEDARQIAKNMLESINKMYHEDEKEFFSSSGYSLEISEDLQYQFIRAGIIEELKNTGRGCI